MAAPTAGFEPTHLTQTAIRDLGLTITGTPLEPIIQQFQQEVEEAGIRRLHPRFYLSTEWGVPFGTIAIALPFYLARPELTSLHADQAGLFEVLHRADILLYLRHEMGLVVNYAYRLYEQAEWSRLFGPMTQPYVEDYRAQPFNPRHVIHLPGWYAQKHPDEDWAETFAVWLTPGSNWRSAYAQWPVALAKLEYCDQTMAALADREPLVTAVELDEDVSELTLSLEQFYRSLAAGDLGLPPQFDAMLRSVFTTATQEGPHRPASSLIRRAEPDLLTDIYRWTGHFPERTRMLLRHLAERAEDLHLDYPEGREEQVLLALTVFVTSLAMNHVYKGRYIPE